jgi:hypothetical protein
VKMGTYLERAKRLELSTFSLGSRERVAQRECDFGADVAEKAASLNHCEPATGQERTIAVRSWHETPVVTGGVGLGELGIEALGGRQGLRPNRSRILPQDFISIAPHSVRSDRLFMKARTRFPAAIVAPQLVRCSLAPASAVSWSAGGSCG